MPNFPNIIQLDCIPTAPPAPDQRCSDPAFALLHPEICANTPALRIKPGVGIVCVLGSIQFTVFQVINGKESAITSGVKFTTSDPTVALVGANSGNCTGVSAGQVNITATYQGMTAQSSVTVLPGLNCCAEEPVSTMLLIDKSRSMSQVFGGAYATKLDYAKALADGYAAQLNVSKDKIGVIEFDSGNVVDAALGNDVSAIQTAIDGIAQTQNLTGIGQALQAGVNALTGAPGLQVLVLISDGEDKDGAVDPATVAGAFRDNGGIMVCAGVRAHSTGFNLLSAIATGGFFVNAYLAVVDDAIQEVYGLKGYICGGQCIPEGDLFQHEPELNYTGFINWDVTQGHVDLLGPGLFDLLPGNGLYVSMASNLAPFSGELSSKATFAFVPGKTYRLSLTIAGNQREDLGPQTVTVKIGNGSQFSQNISVSDYTHDFTKSSFSFSVLAPETSKIVITELGNNLAGNYFGCLIDNVLLEDVTDAAMLFSDNFDDENLQYVPPACGPSTLVPGYYGYYCYGYGCLSDPPGTQAEDNNPLSDIEAGFVPPTTYTATESFTAKCPAGTVQLQVAATKNLVGPINGASFQLSNPQMMLAASVTVVAYSALDGNFDMLVEASNDGITYTTLTPASPVTNQAGVTTLIPVLAPGAYLIYRLSLKAPITFSGTYAVTLLSSCPACNGITKSATATSTISQADANNKALAAATLSANEALSQVGCITVFNSTISANAKCPAGQYDGNNFQGFTRSASATSYISQADADNQAQTAAQTAADAARAADCTASNNTQKIAINDHAPATPFPSVTVVNGLAGTITRVRVNLIGYHHESESDVKMILVSPAGDKVALMWNCGGAHTIPTPINLTFDSNSATPLPANAVFVAGSYAPTQYGAVPNGLAPCPAGPYAADFTGIVGHSATTRNGSWSLWVEDDVTLDVGAVDGGWTLQVDAS